MKRLAPLARLKAIKQAIDRMPYKSAPVKIANQNHCKPVLCVSQNKRFSSLREAAAWVSEQIGKPCSSSAVGTAIRQGRRYKSFLFKYEDE